MRVTHRHAQDHDVAGALAEALGRHHANTATTTKPAYYYLPLLRRGRTLERSKQWQAVAMRGSGSAKMIYAAWAVATVLLTLEMNSTPAVAIDATTTCAPITHDQADNEWESSSQQVWGMRASIQLRTDGPLCDSNSGVGNYVGVVSMFQEPAQIVQIGLARTVDFSNGVGTYSNCRFWATGNGTEVPYMCNATNDVTINFEIKRVSFNGDYFGIYDCHNGNGWSGCILEDSEFAEFANSFGVVSTEAFRSCSDNINGTSADQVNFGAVEPIEGENTSGDFASHSLVIGYPECDYYIIHGNLSSQMKRTMLGTDSQVR